MSLIIVQPWIEDINVQMKTFGRAQIFRSETKHGLYQEITNSNTRLILREDQNYYDFEDWNGSEFFWYKWRLYDDASQENGPWSEPWRGQVPGATYCRLEDVERVLRTSGDERRIRFSYFYKNLSCDSGNEGSVKLSSLSIGPEYSGHEPFQIMFKNSQEFTVYSGESHNIELTVIGEGIVSEDFVASDNSVRIPSESWEGLAKENDIIRFDTDSHMSQADAVRFINDAEVYVDMLLEENLSWLEAKESELRFTRDNIPKTLSQAASRFAAFFIYSSIYNEQTIPGLPGNIDDISNGVNRGPDQEDLSSWATHANRLVKGYVRKYSKYFNGETGKAVSNGAQWIKTESVFERVGICGVKDGVKFPERNAFKIKTEDSFNYCVNYYLLTGGM